MRVSIITGPWRSLVFPPTPHKLYLAFQSSSYIKIQQFSVLHLFNILTLFFFSFNISIFLIVSMFPVPPSILPGLSVVGSAEGQKVQLLGVFFSQNFFRNKLGLLVKHTNDIDDKAKKTDSVFFSKCSISLS